MSWQHNCYMHAFKKSKLNNAYPARGLCSPNICLAVELHSKVCSCLNLHNIVVSLSPLLPHMLRESAAGDKRRQIPNNMIPRSAILHPIATTMLMDADNSMSRNDEKKLSTIPHSHDNHPSLKRQQILQNPLVMYNLIKMRTMRKHIRLSWIPDQNNYIVQCDLRFWTQRPTIKPILYILWVCL